MTRKYFAFCAKSYKGGNLQSVFSLVIKRTGHVKVCGRFFEKSASETQIPTEIRSAACIAARIASNPGTAGAAACLVCAACSEYPVHIGSTEI